MKFVVDQQLPRKLADFIRQRGHDAVHVKDLSLQNAGDRQIWAAAREQAAIIVTKDEDFSLIRSAGGKPQVVWVRLGNRSNAKLLARFGDEWDRILAELEGGAALLELR